MIKFTDEMKKNIDNAYTNTVPMIVATASGSGEPNMSFRGSFMAFDDEHLAFWDRTQQKGLSQIEENPQALAMLINFEESVRLKFFGAASVHRDGEIREQVMARVVQPELDRDPDRVGIAILIKVNRITGLSGNIIQSRD